MPGSPLIRSQFFLNSSFTGRQNAAYKLHQMQSPADARCGLLLPAAPSGYLHNRSSRYCTHSGTLHKPGKTGWNPESFPTHLQDTGDLQLQIPGNPHRALHVQVKHLSRIRPDR